MSPVPGLTFWAKNGPVRKLESELGVAVALVANSQEGFATGTFGRDARLDDIASIELKLRLVKLPKRAAWQVLTFIP